MLRLHEDPPSNKYRGWGRYWRYVILEKQERRRGWRHSSFQPIGKEKSGPTPRPARRLVSTFEFVRRQRRRRRMATRTARYSFS